MKTKNKNNISIVFLFIFVVIVVGLGAWYLGGRFSKTIVEKTDKKTVNKEQQICDVSQNKNVEVLEVIDPKIANLIDSMTRGLDKYCGVYDYFTDKKFTAKDINNELAYSVAVLALVNDKNDYKANFTKEELDNKIAALFGKDYVFTHQQYRSCPTWNYDPVTGSYQYDINSACGGTCGPTNKMQIVKAIKEGNNIYAYTRILFVDNESDPIRYYSDSNKTNLVQEISAEKYFQTDAWKADISKGGLFKITIEVENGNYVFRSAEPATE